MPPSSSAIIGWRSSITTYDFKVYMPVPTHGMVITKSGLSQSSFRACRTYGIRCLASRKRGFGNEPAKKKGNNSKLPKESISVASEPSVAPNDDSAIVEKQLTDKEKATLKERLKQYEAVLSSSPGDPTALEGAAVTLAELGEYEKASSLLEKLTKERPNDIEAYRLLGEVKYELKDFEGSASAYRSSLSASNDTNFEVLRGLTNSLLGAKKPSEAVQVLLSFREKLNDVRPDSSDILVDANSMLEQNMQKFDPIQVELLLGKAYSDWGHVSDAVAVYDQLISNHPDDFRGYLAKGIILKENGKLGDAERMFIQARFFAPEKAKIIVDRYSRQ